MSSAFNPMHLGALFGSHVAIEGSTLGYEGLGELESSLGEIVNHAMASSSLKNGRRQRKQSPTGFGRRSWNRRQLSQKENERGK